MWVISTLFDFFTCFLLFRLSVLDLLLLIARDAHFLGVTGPFFMWAVFGHFGSSDWVIAVVAHSLCVVFALFVWTVGYTAVFSWDPSSYVLYCARIYNFACFWRRQFDFIVQARSKMLKLSNLFFEIFDRIFHLFFAQAVLIEAKTKFMKISFPTFLVFLFVLESTDIKFLKNGYKTVQVSVFRYFIILELDDIFFEIDI